MIAFGEFDIAERPRDEVGFYKSSVDITLFVLAGSYHCHNFQEGSVDTLGPPRRMGEGSPGAALLASS